MTDTSDIDANLSTSVRVISRQLAMLFTESNTNDRMLNQVQARNLVEYVRALTMVRETITKKGREASAELQTLTDEALEAALLLEARRVQESNGNVR